MKHIILLAGLQVSIVTAATAYTTEKLTINNATVFISGAELLSTGKVNLAKGENEIAFTNVAGDVNNQSIVVSASNGVAVESVTFQNDYLDNNNVSPAAKRIKDSIDLVSNEKQLVSNKIAVLNEQLAILQDNRKVSGANTGLSVTELQKMLDLVNARMEGYLNKRNEEAAKLTKIDERLARLNNQYNEEQQKGYQPGGRLLVKFYAKEATSSNVTITYVVPNAGWTPTYDISADDTHSPIKFYYKANVYQNSGVKWDNVHLALSTGNPQEGMQTPVLNPWYLSFYQPVVYNRPRTMSAAAPMAKMAEGSASTWSSQSYTLSGVQVMDSAATISEYVAVDNSGVSTTFDIDLPYSIPSDGQQHLVSVKKYEAPATYQYFAVPKTDRDAFLQAQVTGWQDLNLLPGPTNIFYEGVYVGQGHIDPNSVTDTLAISLGRDKKVVIKREQDKKLRSVKTIGSNVRETFAYNITVRNTRKDAINIVLLDQQPVSNDKDIVLDDQETGGSEYNTTTGEMKWRLNVGANETKKIAFGYTIKYPKGKTIAGLR